MAIGLDIGHSAVKISAGDTRLMFPTAACLADDLAVEEAARAAAKDTVRVDGVDYWVGDTALIHTNGRLLEGLSDAWIETPEHLALMVAGHRLGRASAASEGEPILVMGLPSRLYAQQHKRLRELAQLKLQLPEDRVRVIPQPLGAYMSTVLDANGNPKDDRDITEEKWGVIDIGYYTTDFGLLIGGVWSQAGARSTPGASTVAQALREAINSTQGVQISLRDADKALRDGTIRLHGKVIDIKDQVAKRCQAFARTINEGAINTFGDGLPLLDGIIVAGGGADLVLPVVKRSFDHVVGVENPRYAVAEGLRRYGLLVEKQG